MSAAPPSTVPFSHPLLLTLSTLKSRQYQGFLLHFCLSRGLSAVPSMCSEESWWGSRGRYSSPVWGHRAVLRKTPCTQSTA